MGLLSGARRFLAMRFLRGLLKDVEAGKYGQEAKAMLKWLRENKAKVGVGVTFVAAGLVAIGYTEAATALGLVATALLGAGWAPSDKEARRQ